MARTVGGPLGGSMLSTGYGKRHATLGTGPNPKSVLSPPLVSPSTSDPTPTNPGVSSPLFPPVPKPLLTNLSASTDFWSLQGLQALQEERSNLAAEATVSCEL